MRKRASKSTMVEMLYALAHVLEAGCGAKFGKEAFRENVIEDIDLHGFNGSSHTPRSSRRCDSQRREFFRITWIVGPFPGIADIELNDIATITRPWSS